MEKFRKIGEILGSLQALMVFREDIRVNQRQCSFLVDIFVLAFETIADEMKQNLKFHEKGEKWNVLELPLTELYRTFKDGEQYVRQCIEVKDWLAKSIHLSQSTDFVELHLHNLFWCVTVVIEAIEIAGEISGSDHDEIQQKKFICSKKYEKDWLDPKLFRNKFGKQYLISDDICNRLKNVWKEDQWILLESIREIKRTNSSITATSLKKDNYRVADLLFKKLSESPSSTANLFPSSILIASKDYQVRKRLAGGNEYKEIQWRGENFAMMHFYGDIEPLVPEISRLSSLHHPHIQRILCGFSDAEMKECFLIMDLMNRDLSCYIKEISSPRKKMVPFSLHAAVDIMLQIARGMEYLHSRRVYHGELNPSNILVKTRNSLEGHLHIKISGFALCSLKNIFSKNSSNNQTIKNPFIWYAPEVLAELEEQENPCDSKYTEKADVYSFGMICFELLTGKVPFEDFHFQGEKMSKNIKAGERPLFPFPTQKDLTKLTKRCWKTEPIQRPTFVTICRILRYIKRSIIFNPDQDHIHEIDYYDLDMGLSKQFGWNNCVDPLSVTQIPFQIFAYKVAEKEKPRWIFREKSSESGSDETSVCEDESSVMTDDFCYAPVLDNNTQILPETNNVNKKALTKKNADGKINESPGKIQKRGEIIPASLTPCRQSLRIKSESQFGSIVFSPSRHRRSVQTSDSGASIVLTSSIGKIKG